MYVYVDTADAVLGERGVADGVVRLSWEGVIEHVNPGLVPLLIVHDVHAVREGAALDVFA